jgi:hypothetical protein
MTALESTGADATRSRAASSISREVAKRVRLVGLDVDGVLTEGGTTCDVDGADGFKRLTSSMAWASRCRSRRHRGGDHYRSVSDAVAIRARERASRTIQDKHARKPPRLKLLAAKGLTESEVASGR